MKNTLRSLAAAGALVLMATSGALAEWKPSGPITMLIGFAAGGGADTQARMIAEELERRHGWQIIPEQATGGGGAKLSAKIKDMPNDGTVIGLADRDLWVQHACQPEGRLYPGRHHAADNHSRLPDGYRLPDIEGME